MIACALGERDQEIDDGVKNAVDPEEEQRQNHHEDEYENCGADGFFARRPHDLARLGANLIHKFGDARLALFLFGHGGAFSSFVLQQQAALTPAFR